MVLNSLSEDNGIAAILPEDKKIYSVGISTAGSAEIRMAQLGFERHIVATSIDPEGIEFARTAIEKAGLTAQIELKIEDVSEQLPYKAGTFDYIYARLILHYLPKAALEKTLSELHRVLKEGGRLFVVVRSVACKEVQDESATFDPNTHLTRYFSGGRSYARYFHSEESIQTALKSAGFLIQSVQSYEEQLCTDFARKIPSEQIDVLIETLVQKR